MYHNIPIMIKYIGHFIAFCYCVQKSLLTLLVCCTITEFCCFFLTRLEKKKTVTVIYLAPLRQKI